MSLQPTPSSSPGSQLHQTPIGNRKPELLVKFHKTKCPSNSLPLFIVSLEIVWTKIILRSYSATVLSFISICSSADEKLSLQEIWTDERTGCI